MSIVTLPACRIGKRWGATRTVYRIQQEQHMVLLFFILLLNPKAVNPGAKGQSPLWYSLILQYRSDGA